MQVSRWGGAAACPWSLLSPVAGHCCCTRAHTQTPPRPPLPPWAQKLLAHAPLGVDKPRFTDPHTKVNALLQSHFSRAALAPDMAADQRRVVGGATRLLQAMVDVISSSGWLNPALAGALGVWCGVGEGCGGEWRGAAASSSPCADSHPHLPVRCCCSHGDEPDGDAGAVAEGPGAHAAAPLHPRACRRLHQERCACLGAVGSSGREGSDRRAGSSVRVRVLATSVGAAPHCSVCAFLHNVQAWRRCLT